MRLGSLFCLKLAGCALRCNNVSESDVIGGWVHTLGSGCGSCQIERLVFGPIGVATVFPG